jgi:hypothetical protein
VIYATDHIEASPLMVRAYRKISGRSELAAKETQADFEELWKKLERDEN